jgi:predicted DNA-binding protein
MSDNTTMRNTKVYSITMPPEMARQAERLAKRESRTMSELMREAFRRYQVEKAQAELLADPLRAGRLAELKQVLGELQQESVAKGLDKITDRQLVAEVEAVRKQRRKKIKSSAK